MDRSKRLDKRILRNILALGMIRYKPSNQIDHLVLILLHQDIVSASISSLYPFHQLCIKQISPHL